ncbi:MAG: tRNA (adenosine(37)-N6)-dimethylallyltransferase, partial [Steroidobacteraceae bacterium]
IAPTDRQRIQRALEVCHTTGRAMSELQRATVSPLAGWRVRCWMLRPPDRAALHERLARRFDAMMAGGFLDEVRRLRDRGDLTARHPAMRAVGYRQLWAHLDGQYDLTEARRRAIAATRQLAKRQLTWMRSQTSGQWLDPQSDQASWNRDICHELASLGI